MVGNCVAPRSLPAAVCRAVSDSGDRKTFVGELVMKREMTPLLEAAATRGCRFQVGTDMLFEQIPAYLEFFGYGTTTPEELRTVAKVSY
jgi:shikimate dehydrogenase